MSDDHQAWAAQQRADRDDMLDRYYRDTPDRELPDCWRLEPFERGIAKDGRAWAIELDRRMTATEKRRLGFIAKMPKRAAEAATSAEMTNAIVAADNWYDATRTTGGIIVFSGPVGTGKTTAAMRVAWRHTSACGWLYTFVRAADLVAMSRYSEERKELLKATHIVVDDLGAEYADTKGSFLADLDELIDRVYSDQLHMVITTNLPPDTFKARYGVRIVDRLRECGKWISVTGESRRKPA